MRVLKFSSYNPEEREVSVQARAWIILWSAVGVYPAGNKEQCHVGNQAYSALREASEEVNNGEGRRLKPSGAELYLEDAEYRLINNAVEKIRDQIRIANVDALIFVDKLLEKAPEVSKKDYISKVKKIKLEPSSEA